MHLYLAAWGFLCLCAIVNAIAKRQEISFFKRRYFSFIFTSWKLMTFLIAAISITTVAPFTHDPTWDYFDASLMSILTYLTAPYSVGTLARSLKRKGNASEIALSLAFWFLSASGSYDLYLFARDGEYPSTWSANIAPSSVLYILAGLLWNIDWTLEKKTHFSFTDQSWPQPNLGGSFKNIAWLALPIMLAVAIMIGVFLL